MQQAVTTPSHTAYLVLAYVEDAHNVGCLVRVFGEQETRRAQYSAAIQQNGVVIRTCHVIVVDLRRDPLEVVWRIGTGGVVEAIGQGKITLNLGYRTLTIPLKDGRPEDERSRPITTGDRVLLQGRPIEQAEVRDIFVDGELAHPERLRGHLERVVEQHVAQ